jgi:hypothetical protein
MRIIALAAASAMIVVSGCSAAPDADPGPLGSSGAASFWDHSRLVHAQPLGQGRRAAPLPGQTPAAHAAPAALRVGALFEHDETGEHFCTASVVASPGEDLLITAAHCINDGDGSGYKQDVVFIPGYRDGATPYGIWTPQRLIVAPQWADSADPDFDVGFIVLQPHDGENIQQVLGANHRVPVPGAGHRVPEQRRRPHRLRQLDVSAKRHPAGVRLRRVHRRHQRQPVGDRLRPADADRHDRGRDRRLPAGRRHPVGLLQRLLRQRRLSAVRAGHRGRDGRRPELTWTAVTAAAPGGVRYTLAVLPVVLLAAPGDGLPQGRRA